MTKQVRHLGLAVSGRGGVASFINKALTPPADTALDNALTLLTRIGAFRGDESLTPLVSKTGVYLTLQEAHLIMATCQNCYNQS